jgi:hypothetical protein
MKRCLGRVALLVLAIALLPVAAPADQTAAVANALAVEQGLDCLSTLVVLHEGGWERDSLALPFTHSPVAEFGAALAVNLVLRRHASIRIMHTLVAVYPVVLLGNVRAITAPAGVAGLVKR